MPGYNKFYADLCAYLDVTATSAERFKMKEAGVSVDLLTFKQRPFKGVNSVITNGLACLKDTKGDELIFSFHPDTILNTDVNGFVATYIQLHYLRNLHAIRIGDYFKVEGRLLDDFDFKGIYTISPVYFPEDFEEKNSTVRFLWLIPISESEFKFLHENGRAKFEELLEQLDPDLTRLDRKPVV